MSFPTYPPGPFTPQYSVGGFGGSEFRICGWEDNKQCLVVTKFQVWWDSGAINGVQVSFSNYSSSPVYGRQSGDTAAISFAPGEKVTSFTLWGNGKGSRSGRVKIMTDRGQTFDNGKNVDGQTAYSAPIGGGIFVGIVGRSGNALDMLGGVFLRSDIVSVKVDQVQYLDSLQGTTRGLATVSLSEVQFSYENLRDGQWNFTDSTSRLESRSFTQSTSTTFGVSVAATISAEAFGIGGSVETGFKWETTSSTESNTTTSNQRTLAWSLSGSIASGEKITCTSVTTQGTGSLRYNSRVTVRLEDGYSSSYPEKGVMNNVLYTSARAKAVKG